MNKPVRIVEVTYLGEDGKTFSQVTNMAAHLSDAEILDYFRQGRKFNKGKGESDYMAVVQSVQIIN